MSDVNPTFCPYPKKWTYEDISITIFQKDSIGVIEITISYGEDKKIIIQILQEKYNDRMFNPEEGKAEVTELISSLLKTRYRELEKWYLYNKISNWAKDYLSQNTNVTNIYFHQELGISGGFTKKSNGEIEKINDIQWKHCWSSLAFPRKIIDGISIEDFYISTPSTVEVIFYDADKPKVAMEIERWIISSPNRWQIKRIYNLIPMIKKTLSKIPHKELSNSDLCQALVDWAKEHIAEDGSIIAGVNIFWQLGYSIRVEDNILHNPERTEIHVSELNLIKPY